MHCRRDRWSGDIKACLALRVPGSAIPATEKSHPTRPAHAFYTQMKKNNGRLSRGRLVMDYAAAAMTRWRFTAWLTPGARRRCAVLDCSFAGTFDCSAWSERGAGNRWDWFHRQGSSTCVRRAISGGITPACRGDRQSSSDAKRVLCTGRLITREINFHLRA